MGPNPQIGRILHFLLTGIPDCAALRPQTRVPTVHPRGVGARSVHVHTDSPMDSRQQHCACGNGLRAHRHRYPQHHPRVLPRHL